MRNFWAELKTQRWDDHRYYHHSRINQSLHLLSAVSFLSAYALIFKNPAASALIIFLSVTSLPFEIYLMKNFIDAVPTDLEEAARIESASTFQVLRRVVVPLAMPGIAAASIFGFVNAWGSFVVPLILISPANQQPAPIAIYTFLTVPKPEYGNIAAYSLVFCVPVFILYAISSRLFREGFVLGGGVKG